MSQLSPATATFYTHTPYFRHSDISNNHTYVEEENLIEKRICTILILWDSHPLKTSSSLHTNIIQRCSYSRHSGLGGVVDYEICPVAPLTNKSPHSLCSLGNIIISTTLAFSILTTLWIVSYSTLMHDCSLSPLPQSSPISIQHTQVIYCS